MAAGPQAEVPMSDPMRQAWEDYMASEDYKNSRYWAMRLAPFMQAQMPADEAKVLECGLMPLEQRQRHVDGSMWAAFCTGWSAAKAATEPKRVERLEAPTIAELEAILNDPNPSKVTINPDGSVTTSR